MNRLSLVTAILFFSFSMGWASPASAQYTEDDFSTTIMASDLEVPWELKFGPDGKLWFTERPGRVRRMDVQTGNIEQLVDLNQVLQVQESGLLGMAFHPQFEDTPAVFLSYTYRGESGGVTGRISRFELQNGSLGSETILLEDIPGNNIHNGSRLVVTPDHKLLATTGDAAQQQSAQDKDKLSGKVLRMNHDGSIPADNPFPNSYVYSYGHRNPQGMVILPDSTIVSSEHGPTSDDEVNVIRPGANYGWPQVRGYCNQTSERSFCNQNDVVEPMIAWTPTVATSGIDYYDHQAISCWQGKLLMLTLKQMDLRVMTMNADRDSIIDENILFDQDFGRLRDLAIGPDGSLYFSTSNRDGYAPRPWPKEGDDHIVRVRLKSASTGRDAAQQGVTIYPTPSVDSFTLAIPKDRQVRYFQLYSLAGSEIMREKDIQTTRRFSTDAMEPGVYLYQLEMENGELLEGKIILR